MRILWAANTLSPEVASELGIRSCHSISWVDAMSKVLVTNPGCQLAIVSSAALKQISKRELNGIVYYVLPEKKDGLASGWHNVIEEWKPDVIHVYGTERKQNLPLFEMNLDTPILISLQGIISEYAKRYYGGLSIREILSTYTIRDVLLRDGIISGKRRFEKQAKYEKLMLQKVNYVEGRSDWDYIMSRKVNEKVKYFYCPRMLRTPFFEHRWQSEIVEAHSVFVHQGNYPIKGLHFMLDALAVLKKKYPDVKLYIAGNNIFERKGLKYKLGMTGYIRLIKKKIHTLDLRENIVFTGYLNANALAETLARMHVCVIPSVIENAPNALAEAMVVGTPCIASYVGGNADMLNQGECGLLYRFDEADTLAQRITDVFEDNDLARRLSEDACTVARTRHDCQNLNKRLLSIYTEIIRDFDEGIQ